MCPPAPANMRKLKEGNKTDIINHRQYGFSRDFICEHTHPRQECLKKSASVYMCSCVYIYICIYISIYVHYTRV
jgi:hypothetical protein